MLIKFQKPDPRAGMVARMDSSLGQRFVDAHSAVRLKEDGSPEVAKLREDGPTVQEFVDAGYPASNYPPNGYASRSTPEEIAAAVATSTSAKNLSDQARADAQAAGAAATAADEAGKMTAAELRAALDAKGITYKANASKSDLLALLPAA